MRAYLNSQEHVQALKMVGHNWNAILGTPCTTEEWVQVKAVKLLTPVEFSGDSQYPSRGEWQEHFTIQGCGFTRGYLAFFQGKDSEKPNMTFYFVGESLASPQLIKDILALVRLRAAAELPSDTSGKPCQRIVIADTKLTTGFYDVPQPNGPPIRGVRNEEWVAQGCGATARMDVLLTPKPDGGTHIKVGIARR